MSYAWVLLKGSNEPSEWWRCRHAVFMGMVAYAPDAPASRMCGRARICSGCVDISRRVLRMGMDVGVCVYVCVRVCLCVYVCVSVRV
jgi:hypothetical protein